jgi:hypothetical protein
MSDSKISSLTAYTTPLDADVVPVVDTANAETKKTTWANVKATLKAYFDTQYLTEASGDAQYEVLTNKSTDTALGTSDTLYPTQNAVKTYADTLVAGLLDYRGAYDASVNTFPASGGSGTAGAVKKGDAWVISVAGTLGGSAIQIGDMLVANVDTPGQTDGNWNKLNTNISYVPEDAANKVTSISGASTDTQYPSAKLTYDQLALKLPLAGGTMSGDIILGENTGIALDPAGSADGKYTGIKMTATAGATVAFGDLVYLDAATSRWKLTDADASATAGPVMLAMCLGSSTDGNAVTLLLQGNIRADAKFPALTIGAPVYVGETAGAIQVAIPTGADNIIRVVGFALTADEIYFNPSQDHQVTVA